MPTYHYWRNVRTGEVYSVELTQGRITAANGPLTYRQRPPAEEGLVATGVIDLPLTRQIEATRREFEPFAPGLPELVGRVEIAERAGTSPGMVDTWRKRHRTFPEPYAALASGPVWEWSDVEAWLRIPRASGRPADRQ
jgi:hypothetical protein